MSIRLLEEVSAFERLCLIDISFSRLQTYLDCSLKYYYTYVLREPRVFGAAAALGSTVHTVLEETPLTAEGDFDLIDILSRFQEARVIHDPEGRIPAELIETGEEILTEFVDRHTGDHFDVVATEMPFAIVLGPALIAGYIDRVDRIGNSIIIVDYKSGRHEVAAKGIKDNLQLGIYALAASHLFPGKIIRAELYYLRSGRFKGHTYTPEDLIDVETRVLSLVEELLEKGNFLPTPDRFPCRFCDHMLSGTCSTGMRRWKSGGTS